MAKITGIGGVFFKSRNKGADLSAWYQKNLGLDLESWGGAILRWPEDKAEDGGLTVWSSADNDTKNKGWVKPAILRFSRLSYLLKHPVTQGPLPARRSADTLVRKRPSGR